MSCLQNVCGVEIVVVRIAVLVVANLQVTQQRLQHAWWDLVFVATTVLVQQVVTHIFERGASASLRVLEQVKVPIVDKLEQKTF